MTPEEIADQLVDEWIVAELPISDLKNRIAGTIRETNDSCARIVELMVFGSDAKTVATVIRKKNE